MLLTAPRSKVEITCIFAAHLIVVHSCDADWKSSALLSSTLRTHPSGLGDGCLTPHAFLLLSLIWFSLQLSDHLEFSCSTQYQLYWHSTIVSRHMAQKCVTILLEGLWGSWFQHLDNGGTIQEQGVNIRTITLNRDGQSLETSRKIRLSARA